MSLIKHLRAQRANRRDRERFAVSKDAREVMYEAIQAWVATTPQPVAHMLDIEGELRDGKPVRIVVGMEVTER